jgi:hypothetical protein
VSLLSVLHYADILLKTLGMIIGHPTSTAGADGEDWNAGLRGHRTTRLTEKAADVAMPPFPDIGEGGEMRNAGQWAVYDVLEEPGVGRGRVFGELDTVEVTREFYEGWNTGASVAGSDIAEGNNDSLAVEALL